MSTVLTKEKICVEDIEFSMDSDVIQSRGTMIPVNAYYIPYATGLSIGIALDNRYSKTEALATFAKSGGDSLIPFKVLDAINVNEAISKQQLEVIIANDLVLQDNVLELDNDDAYIPLADYNPATKLFVDSSFVNRFAGTVSGSFTSADGKTITVIGGLITGII